MDKIKIKAYNFLILMTICSFLSSFLACNLREESEDEITQEDYDIYNCRLNKYFTENGVERGLVLNKNTTIPEHTSLDDLYKKKVFSNILGDVLEQKILVEFLQINHDSYEIGNRFDDIIDHLLLFSKDDYYSLFGDSITESLPPPIISFSRVAFSTDHKYALFYEEITEHLGLGGEGILLLMERAESERSDENETCSRWKVIDEYHLWIS